ncbi:MAG: hypothetical protein ACOYNC_01640 [Bacteroidales bacterium]
MKYLKQLIPVCTLLLFTFIIFSGCKKEADDPVPTFTMSSDTVPLTGGGYGIKFFAKCTNNGVTMTNVTITNPGSGYYTYNFNGAPYVKNALFPLQAIDIAYTKQLGTWKFNMVGKSSGGAAFAVDATLAVTK